MSDEMAGRLDRMRRAMARMLEQGREREFAALERAYQVLKREQAEEAARELVVQARVRRAAVRPVEEPRRWRLPRGFGVSPLARERAVQSPAPVAPQIPVGGLRPWRRAGLMSERIWRP